MNIDEKIKLVANRYVDKYDIEPFTNSSYDSLVEELLKQNDNFKNRILGQEKFIHHPTLNKLGLHLFRVSAAETIDVCERLKNYHTHPLYREYIDNGILILENKYHWYEKQDDELWELLSMCAGRKVSPQPFRDNVFTHFTGDIQNELHTDIFQPNVKSWMYLQDIGLEHGPTFFIFGSQGLGGAGDKYELKLKYLYHMSNLPEGHPDIREGSFPLKDYKKWGFDDPKPVIGKKGTYFICDTSGFHCRGVAKPGTVRKTAKLHYRYNPFDLI